MSAKQLVEARARVEAVCRVIEGRLDIAGLGLTIHHRFQESPDTAETTTGYSRILAETEADWEYRQARIKWFLTEILRVDDTELLNDALHEYVHVLLAPMESEVHDKHAKQCEFAVETVTKAILASWHA